MQKRHACWLALPALVEKDAEVLDAAGFADSHSTTLEDDASEQSGLLMQLVCACVRCSVVWQCFKGLPAGPAVEEVQHQVMVPKSSFAHWLA